MKSSKKDEDFEDELKLTNMTHTWPQIIGKNTSYVHDSGTCDHPYEVTECYEKNKDEAEMQIAISSSFSGGLWGRVSLE